VQEFFRVDRPLVESIKKLGVPFIGKYGHGLALDEKAALYGLLRSNVQATDDRAHG